MASCVENIHTKNYENLIIFVQVRIENVRDVFLRQCSLFGVPVAIEVTTQRHVTAVAVALVHIRWLSHYTHWMGIWVI